MADKALISELTWRSLKMQKDAFPDMPHYIAPDEISELLRSTRRNSGNLIHVVSLAIIADNERDFREFLSLMSKRNCGLKSIEENIGIYDGKYPSSKIVALWRRSRKAGAAKIGGKMSADKKKANSALAVVKIKDRWPLPSKEWPTKALLKEAGVALNTAKSILGRRPVAQWNYQAKMKRAANKVRK